MFTKEWEDVVVGKGPGGCKGLQVVDLAFVLQLVPGPA